MNTQLLIQLLVNGLVVGTLYGVVAMSCVSRAFASVSPTCAYSGYVKLPAGLARWGSGRDGPSTALLTRDSRRQRKIGTWPTRASDGSV